MAAIPQQLALPPLMDLPIYTAPVAQQQTRPNTVERGAARAEGIAKWKADSDGRIVQTLANIQKASNVDPLLVDGWWSKIYQAAESTTKGEGNETAILDALETVRDSVCKNVADTAIQSQVMYEFVQCEMMLLITKERYRRDWLAQSHGEMPASGDMSRVRKP
jgi:hypothetical protein